MRARPSGGLHSWPRPRHRRCQSPGRRPRPSPPPPRAYGCASRAAESGEGDPDSLQVHLQRAARKRLRAEADRGSRDRDHLAGDDRHRRPPAGLARRQVFPGLGQASEAFFRAPLNRARFFLCARSGGPGTKQAETSWRIKTINGAGHRGSARLHPRRLQRAVQRQRRRLGRHAHPREPADDQATRSKRGRASCSLRTSAAPRASPTRSTRWSRSRRGWRSCSAPTSP